MTPNPNPNAMQLIGTEVFKMKPGDPITARIRQILGSAIEEMADKINAGHIQITGIPEGAKFFRVPAAQFINNHTVPIVLSFAVGEDGRVTPHMDDGVLDQQCDLLSKIVQSKWN